MKQRTRNEYTSTRIWLKTVKTLRMIHALTGQPIVQILDRLANAELKRVQKEQEDK